MESKTFVLLQQKVNAGLILLFLEYVAYFVSIHKIQKLRDTFLIQLFLEIFYVFDRIVKEISF